MRRCIFELELALDLGFCLSGMVLHLVDLWSASLNARCLL